ncbi:MAG: hypothetical protein KFH98_16525 [Gemmatimonadetes bacterium]|nr:hypothetical protein [Gemmatimonadota bacterium]
MTRQRQLAAPGTLFLLFLICACGADGTGPDEPEVVMDRVSFNIGHIEVIHDCDPAWDNPGDFQGFLEIWQDVNPVPGNEDYELVAASPKRTILLNSGESASGDHIRAEARIPRDPARPVLLRGFFREMDHDQVDSGTVLAEVIRWDGVRSCWQIGNSCLNSAGPDEWYHTRTEHVHTRDDVWNPFSSDDQGCRFYVTFVANIDPS